MPTPTHSISPPWLYRILIRLVSPLLLLYTLWRAIKDGGFRYFKERLGWYNTTVTSENITPRLWVHAASVGEVVTVMPLLSQWLETTKNAEVVFTTGTPTGAQLVAQENIPAIIHQYLPIDTPGACDRFIQQIQAGKGWIVETEIWPWLYASCEKFGVDLTIVNGRLSDKTSNQSSGLLSNTYQRALANVRILARTEDDKDRFQQLGAIPEAVHFVGNLKFAGNAKTYDKPVVGRPYVVAASTHADEELSISLAWMAANRNNTLLVIAPRHPERGSRIFSQLKQQGMHVCQRSLGQTLTDSHDVYIVDTLGELDKLYQFALAAFVGGSLIKRGGHNVMEPARHACPTVIGPHWFNFTDMMKRLIQQDAIVVARDESDVVKFLESACQTVSDVAVYGLRAQTVAEKDRLTVIEKYLKHLR